MMKSSRMRMLQTAPLVLCLALLRETSVSAFTIPANNRPCCSTAAAAAATSFTRLFSSSNNNSDDDNHPLRSRIAGNARPPTAEEVAIMDEMITKLSAAPAYELPNAVRRAFRVLSSPAFFLQLAARVDQTQEGSSERQQFEALASNLVATLQAVVSTTEEQLEERQLQVQTVVQAAAEPDSGEFLVPLDASRLAAVRTALQKLPPKDLDEGFLSTLDSWMNKSHQDGMDGMVTVLQKVLQTYAGTALGRARENAAAEKDGKSNDDDKTRISKLLQQLLLEKDAEDWDALLAAEPAPALLSKEIQRTLESLVLGLEAGSMAQRVQAEYLQELLKRVEALS